MYGCPMGEIVTIRLSEDDLAKLDSMVGRDNIRTGKTGPEAATRSSIFRTLLREAYSRSAVGPTDVQESEFNASAVVAKLRGVRPAPAPVVEVSEHGIPGDFEEAPCAPEEPVQAVVEAPQVSKAEEPVEAAVPPPEPTVSSPGIRIHPPEWENDPLDLTPDELEAMLRDTDIK